ncbi:YaiI/YqxD family protein [Dethiothermospora halolimnae]|uniref:YaiI/YqxD family protein n=1 Tax=Dethiothermospora halolimnae TaxID=3114390 RepID=UPI003CCC05C5
MKIIVDGDACPVKDIILQISKEYSISTVFIVSINHILSANDGIEIKYCDNYSQSVDIEIVNTVSKGDIVVTNDYGLASLVISKNCYCISPKGNIFNKDNIDNYLLRRHISMIERKKGTKTKGPKKRNKQDDIRFKEGLIKLIEKIN